MIRHALVPLTVLMLTACGGVPPHTIDWVCVPGNGLAAPIPDCSAEQPCTRPLATYREKQLDDPGPPPECRTSDRAVRKGRFEANDAPPRSWDDPDGRTRVWCEFRPESTAPLPLVIYVHGSGAGADTLYDSTRLREKAVDADLSGDGRRGFVLVVVQGRNLHWPTESAQDGSKFDSFYRDPSDNPDFRYLDHLVDELVAEGAVDPARIYVSGWSNGARFGALYALHRHESPTPAGNRVAALAAYSGGDPYSNTTVDQAPSCEQSPRPRSSLPVMLVSRSCDAVACNPAHTAGWERGLRPWEAVPGNIAEDWIHTLTDEIGATDVTWRRIDGDGEVTDACADRCSRLAALNAHIRWPDGIADGSGNDHEPAMLTYLRDHPLEPLPEAP